MALLTGSNKINIAVFISGTGSNLKSLIKFSKLKKSPIIIKLIISNNYKAKGLQYANIYNIKKKVFDFQNTLSEKKVINELKKRRCSFNLPCWFYENFIKNFY
jgi:phosphoribosylglycinamide formyltransferase-1